MVSVSENERKRGKLFNKPIPTSFPPFVHGSFFSSFPPFCLAFFP
jgi:hypothetical protein